MNNEDINTLDDLHESLNDKELEEKALQALVSNPSEAVTNALSDLLVHRLQKIAERDLAEDIVTEAILDRLPEASFQDLMSLKHNLSRDNTAAASELLKVFVSEQSDKGIIQQNLQKNSAAKLADQVYSQAGDQVEVLQAINCLVQHVGLITQSIKAEDIKPAETTEEKKE